MHPRILMSLMEGPLQSPCQNLSNNHIDTCGQTNGSNVFNLHCSLFLRNQENKSIIQRGIKNAPLKELPEHPFKNALNAFSIIMEEIHRDPSGLRDLFLLHSTGFLLSFSEKGPFTIKLFTLPNGNKSSP